MAVSAMKACGRTLLLLLKVWMFAHTCLLLKVMDVWGFAIDGPSRCRHQPLANGTGLKVVVAGLAKTGTRSIIHALEELGVRGYHSEDFFYLPWWRFAKTMEEQHQLRMCSSLASTYVSMPWDHLSHAHAATEAGCTPWGSLGALADPAIGVLSEALSECRVEAVALDGLEALYRPLVGASPGVKVVMLKWRSYRGWLQSAILFGHKLRFMCWFALFTNAPLQGPVPWGALLWLVDPLLGSPLRTAQELGVQVCEQSPPMLFMHHQMTNHRRQYSTWTEDALGIFPRSEPEYEQLFEDMRAAVPADDLLQFDPSKSTWEDLCRFLQVEPCPRKGKVPRAINTWIFERDFPVAGMLVLFVRLFVFWVNWRLVSGLVAWGKHHMKAKSA